MSHLAGRRFWRQFEALPLEIQKVGRENFQLLKSNPQHPSLHFKRIGKLWSVRIGLSHRALGADSPEGIVWFWIGPHPEYEKLIGR